MSKTTREEILKKATSLFLKNGYEQTSLTDIANAVGLQKPSLYSRFKSKEGIFRKVVEYYLVNMQKPDKKFGTTTDKSMKEFIEYYLSRVDVCMRTYDKDIYIDAFANRCFSFILELGRFDPQYAFIIPNVNAEEITMWTSVIDQAKEKGEVKKEIDSKQVAASLRYSFLGLCYSCAIGGKVTVEQLRSLLFGIYDTIKV